MIKIKDYIFNENEIRYIKYEENAIFIYLRFDISSFIRFENATFEDIEWNYEDKQIRKCLDSIDREKELEKKNKTFEEYNKDLNNKLDKLEEELEFEKSICSNQAQRIKKQ